MLSFCYESGLVSGHASDAAHFISVATDNFIKEALASVFSRTRSNGPGDSGSAGFGTNSQWVQTHKYRKQLAKEEEAAMRGEITRDKSGLLPVEAKAASERGPLGVTDLRLALEMGDCGMGHFPILADTIAHGYREGELENWEDYTFLDEREPPSTEGKKEPTAPTKGADAPAALPNGVDHSDEMDVDEEIWWEGAEAADGDALDAVLESCLAVS